RVSFDRLTGRRAGCVSPPVFYSSYPSTSCAVKGYHGSTGAFAGLWLGCGLRQSSPILVRNAQFGRPDPCLACRALDDVRPAGALVTRRSTDSRQLADAL